MMGGRRDNKPLNRRPACDRRQLNDTLDARMDSTGAHHQIGDELNRLAEDEDVCILYACESGSRAWGFESTDSDYDVRFLYLHPPHWYLRVCPGRDVIERPIDDQLDISGWDLRKALQLLRKSNPPLLEWLRSPIIYREVPSAVAILMSTPIVSSGLPRR